MGTLSLVVVDGWADPSSFLLLTPPSQLVRLGGSSVMGRSWDSLSWLTSRRGAK